MLLTVVSHNFCRAMTSACKMKAEIRYSTFWVGCPDCDLKSALDHEARDIGNHSY